MSALADIYEDTCHDVRMFAELSPSGLLWLINVSVFHPRGYALAIHMEDGAA
jgi:hypothetical protein